MNTFKPYRWIGLSRKLARHARPLAGAGLAAGHGRRLTRAPLAPLRFLARLLFSDVKLERQGTTLNLTLATPSPEIGTSAAVDEISTEARVLRVALKTLLDVHPATRRVMRHLACVDRALAVQGMKALAEVPVEVLSIAVEQLEILVSNWSNPQLAALRSKMAVAIVDRTQDPFYGRSGDKLSNFNTDSRLLVGDASHSMFLELERQYQDVLPAPSIRAALDRVRGAAKTGALPPRILSDRIPTLHGESRA
jgi:hypothetical protein